MTLAAVAGGAFVVTRDSGDDVIVEDATEVVTDTHTESTTAYSFAAATESAQEAASVVFDMEILSPDGPMSATASFDRASGRLAMDIDLSQVEMDDEVFPTSDSIRFIIDEPTATAYVGADFLGGIFGPTDAQWISLDDGEFTISDDVFGDVFTNPLNIADVFGDVEPIDLGEETIDGEVLRHFEVTLDQAALTELGDDGMLTGDPALFDDAVYDVWVDESSQIRRLLFEAVDDGEVGSVDMWITVSPDPLDIELPPADEVVDLEELFNAAFEDLQTDFSTEAD